MELKLYKTMPKDDAGRVVRYLTCEGCKARLKSIESKSGEVRVAVMNEGEVRR